MALHRRERGAVDAVWFFWSPAWTDTLFPIREYGVDGCPPIVVVRFFDIVGLDEGTCGRRRLLPGLQGSGW